MGLTKPEVLSARGFATEIALGPGLGPRSWTPFPRILDPRPQASSIILNILETHLLGLLISTSLVHLSDENRTGKLQLYPIRASYVWQLYL